MTRSVWMRRKAKAPTAASAVHDIIDYGIF
jgi:hypothetical protein